MARPYMSVAFGGICAALLAQHLWSFSSTVRHALHSRANHIVLEPPGLGKALREQLQPRLSQEDLQTLERDGVVKIRGAVNASILKGMDSMLWDHSQEHNLLHPPYYFNGAVRAMLRDGPLASLAAQATASDKIVTNDMQIWSVAGFKHYKISKEKLVVYHADDRFALHRDESDRGYLLTAWLAITDAPSALRFVRGSHKIVAQIFEQCLNPGKDGAGRTSGFLHPDCVEGNVSVGLSQRLGYNALWTPSASAGDLFLFSSNIVHAGMQQRLPRTALSVRLRGGVWADVSRRDWCHRDYAYERHAFLLLHPRSGEVDCLPWMMLPEMPENSPKLPYVEDAANRLLFWLRLYRLHVSGRATFIKRTLHDFPSFKDL